MASGAVSLRYFVLGLLAQQPMSGYDIKRSVKSLGWLIGSPSGGSLYPILRALPVEGMATVEVIPSPDKPPRKVYTITSSGRQALQDWTAQPVGSEAPLKAFVMRLLLAGSHSQARFACILEMRHTQVSAHVDALQQAIGLLDTIDDPGKRMAFDYGLALATAELAWLDHTLGRLSQPPTGDEEKPSASSSEQVAAYSGVVLRESG